MWGVDRWGVALNLLFLWISTFELVARSIDHDLKYCMVYYMGQHTHFLCARDRIQPPLDTPMDRVTHSLKIMLSLNDLQFLGTDATSCLPLCHHAYTIAHFKWLLLIWTGGTSPLSYSIPWVWFLQLPCSTILGEFWHSPIRADLLWSSQLSNRVDEPREYLHSAAGWGRLCWYLDDGLKLQRHSSRWFNRQSSKKAASIYDVYIKIYTLSTDKQFPRHHHHKRKPILCRFHILVWCTVK